MGRAPCCDKANVKKGPWSPEEDEKLKEYIHKNGTGGNWISLPQKVGLRRCGKSCRLRWLNYLRPNIKHGEFSEEEDRVICSLFSSIGSRWSIIASRLPGRTDNDIKNYWNTKLKKKLLGISQKRPHHHQTCNTPLSSSNNHFLQNSSIPIAYTNGYNNHNNNTPFSRAYDHEPIIQTFSQLMITKEIDQDYRLFNGDYYNQISYDFSNGVDGDNNHKVEEAENNLEYYSIEEIKQLISTNGKFSFFVDEIKTEEKLLDY